MSLHIRAEYDRAVYKRLTLTPPRGEMKIIKKFDPLNYNLLSTHHSNVSQNKENLHKKIDLSHGNNEEVIYIINLF